MKRQFNILKFIFPILLTIFFMRYLIYSLGLLLFSYEWDLSEGLVLLYGRHLSKVLNLYKDTSSYPMIIFLYPPLYPFLISLFMNFFKTSFFIPRLISFLSSLITGWLIYLIVKRRTDSKYAAGVSSLFFFSYPALSSWLPLCRVDSLALVLAGLSLFILLDYDTKGNLSGRKKLLLLPILLLCLYTKQTFGFIPLVAFGYIFLKERKQVLKWLALFLGLALAIFFILQKTSSNWFFRHIVIFNANGFELSLFIRNLKEVFVWSSLLWIMGSISLIYDFLKRKFWIADLYFLFSLITLIVFATPGIGINHYLGMFLGLCLLLGSSFSHLPKPKTILIHSLFILQLIGFQFSPYNHFMRLPKRDSLKLLNRLNNYIKNLKGEILLDVRLGLALKNNKEVFYFAIPYWLNYNVDRKHNHFTLIRDIKNKMFSAIISTDYFWIPEVKRAIEENYVLNSLIPLESLEGWIIHKLYLPR